MKELFQHIQRLGFYNGHLELSITIEGGFEAFTNRACESWTYRFRCVSPGVERDGGGWLVPPINITSGIYLDADAFGQIVLDIIKNGEPALLNP